MQNNNIVMLCLAFVLQLVRRCFAQAGGWFVFPRSQTGWWGLGAFSLEPLISILHGWMSSRDHSGGAVGCRNLNVFP